MKMLTKAKCAKVQWQQTYLHDDIGSLWSDEETNHSIQKCDTSIMFSTFSFTI